MIMADYSLLVNVEAIDKASAVFSKIQKNVNTFKSQVEGAGAVGTNSMEQLGSSMQTLGKNMTATGRIMTATVTTPIVGLGVASTKAAIDFETAFTGVRKTVDTTESNFEKLSNGIKQMSTETASTKTEIAGVMEVAGQLGVEVGKDGETLLSFTRTMVELGDTTNLSAEEAATALAHFTNITGTSQDKVSNLGSAIVDLGNNFATDEASILNMSTRLASAGTIAGLSATDILALSTAMSSVGIQAEAGGTAMTQTLTAISGEVANFSAGAESNLGRIAEIAGMSAEEFATQWETKPIVALQAFITGLGTLGQKGENASLVLDELGMSGVRQSNMLQSLALASGVLGDAIDTSSAAFQENTALSAEAEKRYGTTAAKISQLKEEFTNCAVTVGETLIPFLQQGMQVISGVAKAFNGLPEGAQQLIVKGALLVAAAGPLLSIGGKLISGAGTLVTAFSKVGSVIGSAAAPLSSVGTAAGSAAAPMTSAGTAMGTLSSNALGFIALGAGILLAAAGLALLAQSAIAIGEAGAPAAIAMGAMVAVIAGLAVGAAALAPALTAGAVGLVAFGAAVALVGVGVLAASAGLTLLATQLPTISEYGGSAAVAIAELGAALVAFGGGSLAGAAGATALAVGLVALAAGLAAAGAGAVVAAAGVTLLAVGVAALGVGVGVLSAGVLVLGAALLVCGAGLTVIAGNATQAATGFAALTVACTAAFVPIVAGAASTLALDVALVGLTATLALSAAGALALGVALLAVSAELVIIAGAADEASTDLKSMVTAVDVVETGLSTLKTMAEQAVKDFVGAFKSGTPDAGSAAQAMAKAVTDGMKTGMNPIPQNTNTVLTTMNRNLTSNMQQALQTVRSSISQMEAAFRSARFEFNQHIAVPHFSMSGSFNAKTGATPYVSVSWYRKAYDQAYMFQTPTVVGASGFGDGNGAEVVAGDQHLIDLMREALADVSGNIVIPVYVGQDRIDEMVITAQQRNNFRSGGR